MLVGDWTSNRYVTVFNEEAEKLLGKPAQEIGEIMEHNKEESEKLFSEVIFRQKTFKLRTKIETYQDVPKNKISAQSIGEVNYKEFNKQLLTNIQRLTGISHA
jgi:replication factor A1